MQKPWFPRCHSLWNNGRVHQPLYSMLSWLNKESVGVEVSSDSCGLKVGGMKLTETRDPFISTTCQHQGENNKNKGKQTFSCWQQLCLNWVEYFDQNKVPGNKCLIYRSYVPYNQSASRISYKAAWVCECVQKSAVQVWSVVPTWAHLPLRFDAVDRFVLLKRLFHVYEPQTWSYVKFIHTIKLFGRLLLLFYEW